MATENKIQLKLKRGESKTLRLTITDASGTVVDLTGARVKMTVVEADTTSNVLFTKDSDVGVSEVEIATPTSGVADIFIEPSDTSGVTLYKFLYDIWVELASGKRYAVVCPSKLFISETYTTF